jgi:hypothetical protein
MATAAVDQRAIFKTGYILNPRADFFWFLSLPFWAIAIALAARQWLPAAFELSIALLITVPHHFATWLRTYGFADERERWRIQLFAGPVLVFAVTLIGLAWSPLTIVLVSFLWDHQHSLMQQHGFARIYDFKAGAGAPSTRKFDLALSWVLYSNLFLTTPLWTEMWVRQFYEWNVPITANFVHAIHMVCWSTAAVFAVFYLGHLRWCISQGHPLNPLKYVFLGSSYFLWFFVSCYGHSPLLYAIAHRLMHGLQYQLIVYSYIQRKTSRGGTTKGLMAAVARPRNVLLFVLMGLIYAGVYHFLTGGGMEEFGFGLVNFSVRYDSIKEFGLAALTSQERFELLGLALVDSAAILHYYYDSFIWKVRDKKVQAGL